MNYRQNDWLVRTGAGGVVVNAVLTTADEAPRLLLFQNQRTKPLRL